MSLPDYHRAAKMLGLEYRGDCFYEAITGSMVLEHLTAADVSARIRKVLVERHVEIAVFYGKDYCNVIAYAKSKNWQAPTELEAHIKALLATTQGVEGE